MPAVADHVELASRARAHPAIARVAASLAGVPGCWLVGGAVRDLLLGGHPLDLDVVVEGDALAAATSAAERLGGAVTAHERFGTAIVQADELSFDLAGARRERYRAPGALPEVEAALLEEDLGRRDFTVNAIALGLSSDAEGQVRCAAHADDDLRAGQLRVLHERSFLDDPTRLLRLARYGARLGFEVEPSTADLARAAVAAGALSTISAARVGAELRLMGAEVSAPDALERVSALGADRALHPQFGVRPELARAALELAPPDARSDLVALAACATDFDREGLRAWLDEMEFERAPREAVLAAALDGESLARALIDAGGRGRLAQLARGRPPEQLALAAAHGAGDQVGLWTRELSGVRLEISGDDLLAAGVPPGPRVGAGLAAALEAKLDGRVEGREAELRAASEAAERVD
jgi:tRNA nucleotidyltransferase (CCA-adding enzyme)